MAKDKKEKGHAKPSVWAVLISVLYLLGAGALVFSLIRLDMIPTTYMAIAIGVLAVFSLLLVKGILSQKSEKKALVCALLACFLVLGMIAATAVISRTVSFMHDITADETQVHNYYVVVRMDSKYQTVNDIKGETVYVQKGDDEKLQKAKEDLLEKVDVTFGEKDGINGLAEALIQKEADVLYMNAAFYELSLDEVEGFNEETTRILDTSDVAVENKVKAKKTDVTNSAFNVYISGIDTTGSISNVSRSDVNMVMTVNPVTREILLTSIPRDYYVTLASYGAYDKLTHSGIYGVDETVATVENLLGVDINYYVKVNFTTVTKLVDALGGITVNSDYDFTSVRGHHFVAGENYLNGEEALAFARERYAFSAGDNQRVRNQQAVISGIIQKVTGSTAILTSYSSLLSALDDNVEMNLSVKDITSLVKMQMADMTSWNIQRCSLSGTGDSQITYSMPGFYAYVMRPDWGSVEAAQSKIMATMSAEGTDGE